MTLLGALGFSIFNIALYSALLYTTAINVSIEQAGMPLLIFLANFLFFGVRVSALQIVGFLLSIAGIALTASHGYRPLLALDVNFGDALMLVAVVVYSAYTVALRFRPDIHWQSTMIVLCAAALIISLPFVAAEFWWREAGVVPDGRGWAVIAYTVLFPSLLAQVFYIAGVGLIGANRAGLFINLVPIFGTLLSILVLGEDFLLVPRTGHGPGARRHLAGRDQRPQDGRTASALGAGDEGPEAAAWPKRIHFVRPHLLQHVLRERRIDLDQRDGLAALRLRPSCNVAILTPRCRAASRAADEARLVPIGHVEHVRADLGLELDALDLDDARLAVREHGACHRPRPAFRS